MSGENIVEYVAKLARINLTNDQKKNLNSQLSNILEYVDKLKEVNVEGITPLRSPHAEGNIFRQDKAAKGSEREDILNNSPAREENYFKVPKVID
jgi:aspartyl-tRNA(Asn)/glutamyl-tRNA(Gln) amidotransferase subunit C